MSIARRTAGAYPMIRLRGRAARSRALLLVATTAFAGDSEAEPAAGSPLVIRIHDSSGASPEHLAVTGAELVRILERTGVNAVWLDCSSRFQSAPGSRCTRPAEALDVVLTIVDHPNASSHYAAETLGFSVVPERGGSGVFAGVFLGRVRAAARTTDLLAFRIAGLVAAHEIGHLLLGSQSHSRVGIMSPELSDSALASGLATRLRFSPSETERMQGEIRRRQALLDKPRSASAD